LTVDQSVEFEHCRELAMPPGSLFEFTSRFLPAGQREQLVALYALKQAITSIPYTNVDDSVKWAKLNWWNEELTAEPSATSRHPILRVLHRSGARVQLDTGLLQRLVYDSLMQIDTFPVADREELYGRFATSGETDILLELALNGAAIPGKSLRTLGFGTGLYGMISGFLVNYPANARLIPLDLLAEHKISATQLQQHPPVPELVRIITHLTKVALESYPEGISGPSGDAGEVISPHLKLRRAMESRHLKRIIEDARSHFNELRIGPSDAWFAWRFMRRFGRT
jgi:phytoene/squalene synthetase